MDAQLQSKPPLRVQRHEVARDRDLLEAASALELGQRVLTPQKIDEVPQLAALTDFDGLRNQAKFVDLSRCAMLEMI